MPKIYVDIWPDGGTVTLELEFLGHAAWDYHYRWDNPPLAGYFNDGGHPSKRAHNLGAPSPLLYVTDVIGTRFVNLAEEQTVTAIYTWYQHVSEIADRFDPDDLDDEGRVELWREPRPGVIKKDKPSVRFIDDVIYWPHPEAPWPLAANDSDTDD